MKKLSIFLLLIALFSCDKKEAPKQDPRYPVKVAKVIKRDAPIYLEAIGHVTALAAVDIRSRIEGELQEVYFKEGDEVQEGQPLFLIDPRPYQNDLKKLQAQLQENEADLYLAKDKLARYTFLAKDDYVSQLDMDTLQSNVVRLQAAIEQNKADIEQAQLNISYCHIYAPINGKTGILQLDKGNLIPKDDQTPIISINTISPIYVVFSLPENDFLKVQKYKDTSLKTVVRFDDLEVDGELNLIDNQVDTTTAMIKLRAIFTNKKRRLWPGQFVKTRLILSIKKDALIIPSEGVIITESGPVVFVLKEDMTTSLKKVELGEEEGENIIILSGLNEGETVITEGQINLKEGSKVFITQKVHTHESI